MYWFCLSTQLLPTIMRYLFIYLFYRSVEGNFSCLLRPPEGFVTVVHFCSPNAAMAQMGRRKVFGLIFSLLTLDGELGPQQAGPRAKVPAPSSTLKGFSVPGMVWCHQLLNLEGQEKWWNLLWAETTLGKIRIQQDTWVLEYLHVFQSSAALTSFLSDEYF